MDTPSRREILQEYEFELLLAPGLSATYFLGDQGSNRGLVLRDMRRREYIGFPSPELTREIGSVPLRRDTVFSIRKATLVDVQNILFNAAGLLDNFQPARRLGIRFQVNRALAVTTREGARKQIEGPLPEEQMIHGLPPPPGMRRIETPRFQGMLKLDPVQEPRIISIILKILGQLDVLKLIRAGFSDKQTEFVFAPTSEGNDRTRQSGTDHIVAVMHEFRERVLRAGIPQCGVVTNEILGLFGY